MAGLLSNPQIASIRTALNSVLETFQVVPVVYLKKGSPIAPYMEDYGETQAVQTYSLLCIVTHLDGAGDRIVEKNEGLIEEHDVMLEIGVDYLIGLSLWNLTTNLPLFNAASDSFTIGAETYKTTLVVVDGNFETKAVLVKVYGKKQEKFA